MSGNLTHHIAQEELNLKSKPSHRLTLQQKLEIIKLLDENHSKTNIADQYGVTRTAIYKIYKSRDKILKFSANNTSNLNLDKKKSIKPLFNEVMDEILISWISQIRQQGTPISGPLICEAALKINKMIGGPENFKASEGWLNSFKNRYGIRKRSIQGEKLSANVKGANKFKDYYQNFVTENGYEDKNVLSANKTGLNWRLLPRMTLALGSESSCPRYKLRKENVSVLFCANADDSCRLPPLVIGKSQKPQCFKRNVVTGNNEVSKQLNFNTVADDVSNCTNIEDMDQTLKCDYTNLEFLDDLLSSDDALNSGFMIADSINSTMNSDNRDIIADDSLINNKKLLDEKALEAVEILHHWHLVNCDFNSQDAINDLKLLDNIKKRIIDN